MAIEFQCAKCGVVLTAPGGLMFSPPTGNYVTKFHLCVPCWEIVATVGLEWMRLSEGPSSADPPGEIQLSPAPKNFRLSKFK